uniref:alanine transaminase n=1 Tax=Acanthochromis polyacanthus TaxID=80966 RepID=A0A3Q1F5R4_9TELE
MTSLQHVNPRVRGIRVSPQNVLQSLGAHKPFKEVIDVSSGDPHRAGMKPVSFVRQVLAVCLYPELLKDQSLPLDVKLRAQRLLEACDGGSVGSYSDSSGLLHVRQSIAEFITKRDAGVPSYDFCLISKGIVLLASGEGETQTGVLTPMPCPHTLPTLLDEAEVALVPYQLVEERGWAVHLEELHRAVTTARGHCQPRAIYISNPGNPTGHVQTRESMEEVIRFAAAEGLLLFVDEVYQDSMIGLDREFISYKRVLFEMGKEYAETVELVSSHSLSCTSIAECGQRAGYMEIVNMDPEVMHFVDTMLCTDVSTPITGQLALDLMVNPPKPGDPSYDTYTQETLLTQTTLSQNAQRAVELLNDLPGMSCQPAMGGIYLYPCLHLPSEFRQLMLEVEAHVLYCQKFLEEEGVLVGTKNNRTSLTWYRMLHFLQEVFVLCLLCHRLCVHVPPDTMEEVLTRLRSFHLRLMDGHCNSD